MEAFAGSWTLSNSENYDEYLKALEISITTRAMLGSLHPTITISKVSDDTWTFKTATHVKTTEFTFKLGEEFEETSVDGRLCKSVLTFEDGKLKLVQHATKQGERDTEITREVVGNQLIMTMPVDNIVCVRTYTRN